MTENMTVGGRRFAICFLSSMHVPRDKRVFDKEAVSLARGGYDVTHLAPQSEQGDDTTTADDLGVKIITYKRPRGIVERLLQLPRLYIRAIRINADCYHCNEVDSWFIGVLLKLTRRKKIVFDVHEHYPSTFAEGRFPLWMQPAIAAFVRVIFRCLIPFTDQIVFAKRSVAPDFRGSEKKQVLVQNFATLAAHPQAHPQESISNHVDSDEINQSVVPPVTIIHLGLFSRVRGWPELLDALHRVRTQNLKVLIIGTFNDGSLSDFQSRAIELGLSDQITVEEWMPFSAAYKKILCSQIGLVLFQPGPQNHTYALPHKMFDYMMAGLPVIAPDFALEVAHIIRESDCGILVDSSKPDEIAKALDFLASNEMERNRLGRNGRAAVISRYNWEAEASKLIDMYRKMESNAQ